jgi:hypothetical protein
VAYRQTAETTEPATLVKDLGAEGVVTALVRGDTFENRRDTAA